MSRHDNCRRPFAMVLGSLLILGALLATPLLAAEIERFEVIAQGKGKSGFAAGQATRLNIIVDKYSTLEDRAKLIDTISHGDGQMINKYLEKLPRIGVIQIPGQPGKDLKYIYNYTMDDGSRQVVMGADRPYLSATAPTRGGDVEYLMVVVAFTLDKNGRGDGTLAPAAEMQFVNGKVKETNSAADPITLTSVVSKKK